jgi:hypothetical protein
LGADRGPKKTANNEALNLDSLSSKKIRGLILKIFGGKVVTKLGDLTLHSKVLLCPKTGLRIRIHFIRIRIQHFRLNTDLDPDPIQIQGFNDQKLNKKITAEKKLKLKTTIYLSLGLHKERPSYRRSLQISKEATQHFKT